MSSLDPLQDFYGDNALFEDEKYQEEDPELQVVSAWEKEIDSWIKENV